VGTVSNDADSATKENMTTNDLVIEIKKTLAFEGHSMERRWMEVQGLLHREAVSIRKERNQLRDALRAVGDEIVRLKLNISPAITEQARTALNGGDK